MTEAPAAPRPTSLYGALTLPLRVLGSLQVTVALFVAGMVLVFFGTMAQMNDGIWTVVSQYFWSYVVWIPNDLIAKFAQVFLFLPKDRSIPGHFPFPAGKLLGGLMFVNLFAAHTKQLLDLIRVAVKQREKRGPFAAVAATLLKRSGIYVIHGGLLLLFVGEFITREFQVEQRMMVSEGQTVNWTEDTRAWELYVQDVQSGTVTVIPHTRLKAGETVRHPDLPADLEILDYFPNTDLKDAKAGNRATAGFGLGLAVVGKREVSGVDPEQRVDMPGAYVRVKEKGGEKDFGTYLASTWQAGFKQPADTVAVAGKTYEIGLRCKRHYKPYSVHLIDFKFDKYVGTAKAKNYSSDVRLIDSRHGLDRTHLIAMNEPLRYDGDAFYQSSFEPDETGTILQVVENPGWMIPYISCVMVTVGMMLHFGLRLVSFLRAGAKTAAAAKPGAGRGFVALFRRSAFAAAGVGLVFLLSIAGRMSPGREPYDLAAAGKLPAVESGREQPLDTFARVSLRVISGRETYKDLDGDTQPAIKWFFEVAANGSPERNDRPMKFKVFKIENDQVLAALGLTPRKGFLYALDEFKDKVPVLSEKANEAAKRPSADRDLFDRQVLVVAERVKLYVDIATMQKPFLIPPGEDREWTSFPDALQGIQQQTVTNIRAKFGADVQNIQQLPQEQQVAIADSFRTELDRLIDDDPATKFWRNALRAYRLDKGEEFNKALAAYDVAGVGSAGQSGRNAVEVQYNRFAPFYQCDYLYGSAALLVVLGWLFRLPALRTNAFWLLAVTLAFHTVALAVRVYVQGRPPVTNLYSSAIFIGWGCVGLGLILELLYPIGVGNAVAATLGLLTTIVSHQLGAGGDTMEMMQAVLDTNFWLATHVVCVTAGYVATYVAGAVAIGYLVASVFTKAVTPDVAKSFRSMLYGVLAFALLLSFVGTVLGGIWADQSWGRFWGWDPKENGAVLIVLWNALILHARWAGLVKLRGMATLAVFGNCVTTWSWFGTNQLGIGLHNYGFDNTLAMVCTGLWLTHAGLIALGCVPARLWASKPA